MEQCVMQLDQATFKRKSRKALAIICLAMEDAQLPLVRLAGGAHDHGRGWKDISRRRASQTSSFFVVASLRPRWKKTMIC